MILKIYKILAEGLKTFKRFPLEIIAALIGTISSIYLIEVNNREVETYAVQNLLHTVIVGLTFLLSGSVFSERQKLKIHYKLITIFVSLALLVVYYLHLPQAELPMVYIIRASLLFLAFHLIVSFIPFTGKGELLGFWEYNKQLFVSFLTTALYSAVLYIGLTIAIAAVDNLFNIDVDSNIYGQLWVFMVGIFNTWFFLSKYPKDYEKLDEKILYPKALKLFTQYVLLPLVSVYLIILYLYELKIILEWSLPYGWVSYLILAFSVAGILALLLVYPLQKSKDHKWVSVFTKWFYWALFPLIVLFFIAIGKRIMDYGITENRYFVIVLALWLLGISVYLLMTKLKNIKMIPISLAILTLLAIAGPWSAFNVSENSQHKRLVSILDENNVLENGKIKQASDTISFEVQKEISSIVYYMTNIHGYNSLAGLFAKPMSEIIDSTVSKYSHASELLNEMNLKYINSWQTEENDYFTYYNNVEVIEIKNYDYLLNFNSYQSYRHKTDSNSIEEEVLKNDSLGVTLSYNMEQNIFEVEVDSTYLSFDFNPIVKELYSTYSNSETDIAQQKFEIVAEKDGLKVKVMATRLGGNETNNTLRMTNFECKVLIKKP